MNAKILQTEAVAELDAGTHSERLGFAVDDGAADEPVEVTLEIECELAEPCAYLHTSHTETRVNERATISLSILNGWETPIITTLVARVPSGWELGGEGFGTDRCSGGVCNRIYQIDAGSFEFIELYATPNNTGIFDFNATVTWTTEDSDEAGDGEMPEESAGANLLAKVLVTAPSDAAPQVAPMATSRPTATPIPRATATPTPTATPIAGGATSQIPPVQPSPVQGLGFGSNMVFLAVVGFVIFTTVIAAVILIGFRMLQRPHRSPARGRPPGPQQASASTAGETN